MKRKPHTHRKHRLAFQLLRQDGLHVSDRLPRDQLDALMTVLGYGWSVTTRRWLKGKPVEGIEVKNGSDLEWRSPGRVQAPKGKKGVRAGKVLTSLLKRIRPERSEPATLTLDALPATLIEREAATGYNKGVQLRARPPSVTLPTVSSGICELA